MGRSAVNCYGNVLNFSVCGEWSPCQVVSGKKTVNEN